MKKAFFFSFVIAVLIFAFSIQSRCDEYLDALFAPPTQQELDTAFKRMTYKPYCKDFTRAAVYLDEPEYIVYKVTYDSDGLKQTGLFGWPKNASGRVPLIVLNHAGFSGFGKLDNSRIAQFLKRGYAVGVATYRGEGGEAGRAGGDMDIIGDEAHDILNLMECAAADEKVDGTRIAMVGVSHGGGLTIAALTQTRRVKAAATASAPTSLMNAKMKDMAAKWRVSPASVEVILQILMPKEGIAKMKQILGVKEKDPARIPAARQEMLRRSPALFADKIECPVLMWYGGQDPVAIWTDGKLIESSLTKRGIESKVTVFENRQHSYTPAEIEDVFLQILYFFDEKLGVIR